MAVSLSSLGGSPYGGTVTQIGYTQANTGIITYTFSNLSAYKYLSLTWVAVTGVTDGQPWYMRFNSDTSSKYVYWGYQNRNDTATNAIDLAISSSIPLNTMRNDYTQGHGRLVIENSNSAQHKNFNITQTYNNTATDIFVYKDGIYIDTAAISSITLYRTSGNFSNAQTGAGFYLWGAV